MAGFIPKEEAISGLYMRLSGDEEVFGHKDFINDVTIRGDLEISGNMRVSQIVDFTSESGDISGYVFRGETGFFDELVVGETTIGGANSQIGSSVFVGQTGYFDEIVVGQIKADSSSTGGESSGGLDTGPIFVTNTSAVGGVQEILESEYGGAIVRKIRTASDLVDVNLMVERGDAQTYKPKISYYVSGDPDNSIEISDSSLSTHSNGYSFNTSVRVDSSAPATYIFKNGSRTTFLSIERDTPPEVISAEFINLQGTSSFYETSSFNSATAGNVSSQQTEAKNGDTARVRVTVRKQPNRILLSGPAISSKYVYSGFIDNGDGTFTVEANVNISGAGNSPSDKTFTAQTWDLVGNQSTTLTSSNTITTNNQSPSGSLSFSIVPTTVVTGVQVRIGTGHGQWPSRYVYVNLTGVYLGVTSTTLSFGQSSNEFSLSGDGKTLSIKISSSSPTVSWFEAWVNGSIADASAGRSHTYNGQAGSGISNGHSLFSNQVSTNINTTQVSNTTGIINNTTDRVNFNVSANNFDYYNFSKSSVLKFISTPADTNSTHPIERPAVDLTQESFLTSAENASSRTSGSMSVTLWRASNGRTSSFSSSSVQIQSFGTIPSLSFSPNTFSSSNSGAVLNNISISIGEEISDLTVDSVSNSSISVSNLTRNGNKNYSMQISVDDSTPRGPFTINFTGTKIIGETFGGSDIATVRGFNQRTVTALATAYEPVDLGVEIYDVNKLIVSVQPDGGNSFSVDYDSNITGAKQDGTSNLEAAFGIVDGNKIVIDNQVITNAGNVKDVFITVEEPK